VRRGRERSELQVWKLALGLAAIGGIIAVVSGCTSHPTLQAVGAFGSQRFDRRGCRDTEDRLSVAALAVPVLDPAQALDQAR
jgi:hypothetical protein